jgi:metal-responsive CopG/Arc/MetJ family transcriptional regulator
MTENKKNVKWCIPVTISLDKALEQAVLKDSHSTKSEFVREAVRMRLEKMGYNPQVFSYKKRIEVTQ